MSRLGQVVEAGHSLQLPAVRRRIRQRSSTTLTSGRLVWVIPPGGFGLVDYRRIRPRSEETLYEHDVHWTDPDVIRGYVAGYFVHPDPKVWEPLAEVLVRGDAQPGLPQDGRGSALTFQMIHQQPVRYEYHLIKPPTLLIVGAEDHVVPLGQYATPHDAARLGDFLGSPLRPFTTYLGPPGWYCPTAGTPPPRGVRAVPSPPSLIWLRYGWPLHIAESDDRPTEVPVPTGDEPDRANPVQALAAT